MQKRPLLARPNLSHIAGSAVGDGGLISGQPRTNSLGQLIPLQGHDVGLRRRRERVAEYKIA